MSPRRLTTQKWLPHARTIGSVSPDTGAVAIGSGSTGIAPCSRPVELVFIVFFLVVAIGSCSAERRVEPDGVDVVARHAAGARRLGVEIEVVAHHPLASEAALRPLATATTVEPGGLGEVGD